LIVQSASADVSIHGFTFKEATKTSVVVTASADNNEHSFCHSTFDSNDGVRGSAIRSYKGTELFISKSSFVRNKANFGAVYTEGKFEVVKSVFKNNFSKEDGSALYLGDSGKVTIGGTTFKDNKGAGNFISLEFDAFSNDGGNTASGNTGRCGGAYIRQGNECVNFSGGAPGPIPKPAPEPTPAFPPSPPTTSKGKYPVHPVPRNPPPGYFNYDMNDMNYGPNAWHKIPATQTDAYKYWKDLEKYMPADMAKNTCNSKGDFNDNRASPVNLRNTDDNCKEYHQLRPNRRTDHAPLLGRVATVEIKSHSLRISYPRVGKEDLTVPSADIPQGWGKFLHVAYCEFKVPASHTMQGKKFVAEMNCYIIQKAGRGLGVFTILFEIGGFNRLLDQVICSFETVWQKDKNACSRGGRRDLEEEADIGDDDDDDDAIPRVVEFLKLTNASVSEFTTLTNASVPESITLTNASVSEILDPDDDLQGRIFENAVGDAKCGGGWDPFDFMYQTGSWHFYGYRGTLMEPPCSQIVEYRVFDTPVTMSRGQLEDMKRILFTHQDPQTCRYTSVHNKFESVARPLQPSGRSRIHRCTCRDFISDAERNKSGMRTCPRGQEARWMANPTDLVPAPGEQWDL